MSFARQIVTSHWIFIMGVSFFAMMLLFLTVALAHDIMAIWNIPFLSSKETLVATIFIYLDPLAHMTITTCISTMIASLLAAINITLILYIKKQRNMPAGIIFKRENLLATIFVSLGMGCAACGSVVLLSLLSFFGLGVAIWTVHWITSLLMFIAIVVLLYSNYRLYKQAQNPFVCEI